MTTEDSNHPKQTEQYSIKTIFKGILMLGGGKAEGMSCFPSTAEGVLSALSPWLALVLTSLFLPIILHRKQMPLSIMVSASLVDICILFCLPVVIHFSAVMFNKEVLWKRTASAQLWCSWMPFFDLLLGTWIILFIGFSPNFIAAFFFTILVVLFMAYLFWINWFVIRTGLQIENFQAVLVIMAIILVVGVLYFVFFLSNYSFFKELAQMTAIAQES